MTKDNINSKKGFTIIEVVLVLAIAGLIFLMVFVALPALQRSQRDTQRRQDYANLEAAIENYITNNNGRLPAEGSLPAGQYVNSEGTDPEGNAYTVTVVTGDQQANLPDEGTIWVVRNADCSGTSTNTDNAGNAAPKANSATRAFAIYGRLETGTYCQDNS